NPVANFATGLDPRARALFNANLGVTNPGWAGNIDSVFSTIAPSRPEFQGTANLASIKQDIASQVQSVFDAVKASVHVVTSDPGDGDYMRIFLGDGSGLGPNNRGLNGISSAIDLYNQDIFSFTNPTTGVTYYQAAPDIAAIYVDNIFRSSNVDAFGNPVANFSTGKLDSLGRLVPVSLNQAAGTGTITRSDVVTAIANIVAHEAGHNLGLIH